MKTVVISNRKGGSAKTTTAINLAAELAKKYQVLLIDFDTQGHASIGLGSSPVESLGAHNIFLGETLSESFVPTAVHNLTLSPALEFFDVYEFSDLRGVLKNRFKKEKIDHFFDYCIIDTPPTYDALLKNALEVADAVIIPMVPHHLGVIGVSQMMRAIVQMTVGNRQKTTVGIVPVMFNPHINEHKESIQKVIESYGEKKLFSPIGVDIQLSKQFEVAIPVVLQKKRSKGAKDYQLFTQELIKKLDS
jgi:chromosome partitioning protein